MAEVSDAMIDAGIYLAMITPGAHSHLATAELPPLIEERRQAEELGTRTVDLAYGPLKKTGTLIGIGPVFRALEWLLRL